MSWQAGWKGGCNRGGFELRPAALLDLAHEQCNLPLQPLLLGELDRQMAQLRPSSRYWDRVMTLIRQQLWQEAPRPPLCSMGCASTSN